MKKGIKLQSVSIYIALIVVVFLFSVSSDTFLTVPNVINIFRQVSTLGIMAIGATFVMVGIGEYIQIMIKGFVLLFALSTTTLTDYISAQRAKKRTA